MESPDNCSILVVLLNVPQEGRGPERLHSEVMAIRESFLRFEQITYRVEAAYVDSREQLRSILISKDPIVLHLKNETEPEAPLFPIDNEPAGELESQSLGALIRRESIRISCVILEQCYTLERADVLTGFVSAILGVNGESRSALGRFYVNMHSGNNYQSMFDAALDQYIYEWQQARSGTEALPESLPYFITRDWRVLDQGEVQRSEGYNLRAPKSTDGAETRAVSYPVWFATTRRLIDPADASQGFSGERGETVHYGVCHVVVPKSHKIGSLGSPWWQRLLRFDDDRLAVDWATVRLLAEARYWKELTKAIRPSFLTRRTALVFLHGYNVSFEMAALRAAQLGVDLKVDGATAMFSWPSKAALSEYPADIASVEGNENEISVFLQEIVSRVGAERVHVIAHSMGNLGLLRAMQRIVQNAATRTGIKFGQLFLAAPDVDEKLFRSLAGLYSGRTKRTTLYASAKDKALASSGIIRDHPRAGYTPPITVVPGINTVEVSGVDLSYLGHGYFARTRSVLQDMYTLLHGDVEPDKRFGLRSALTPAGEAYWRMHA